MTDAQFHAVGSCLQNPIIIQKILEHLSSNSMENLEWRLLNTSFNTEVLHLIRATYRNFELKFRKPGTHWLFSSINEPVDVKTIHVNNRSVKTERIFDYLKFLSKVVNVKVEHFIMLGFWPTVSCEKWRKKFHDEIHTILDKKNLKTFVGMNDLCAGFCTKCYFLAANSSKYGPLQIGISADSFGNKKPLCFQKLVVGERYLHGTASNILMYVSAEARENCMKYYVDPLISCDQLCFKVSELFCQSEERIPSEPLPLEIIEKMCNVWKAKSIVIEYFWPRGATEKETWSGTGVFTPFRFDELYQETGSRSENKKKLKFSSVTIDMRYTKLIYTELINGLIDENHSYGNLITNVRRIFPTDKISIIGQRFLAHESQSDFTQDNFENILKSVWKNQGHLEVTISHHVVLLRRDFEIPNSICIMGRRLKCTLLPERLDLHDGFVGRTFRITDQIGEKTVNLELMFQTWWLEHLAMITMANNETPLEKGFLKHYYYNN